MPMWPPQMGLIISQIRRSLRLLPISRCPPALRRQLTGRRSARAPGVDVMGVIGGPVFGQTRTGSTAYDVLTSPAA